ncbi:carbohydrate-binding protein [Puniceicoccaceae bacterium K14]|nr:carbohydrate-binding protein [Puniceicoccaceae bacterium K14]
MKNTVVEGVVRNYSDLYNETNTFDLPYRSDYKLPLADNAPIPMNQVFSLCEDGIRMYNGTKSVTVENCTTKRMRSGIRLYLAEGGTITDSYAIDNESTNFNLPAGGTITNSSGNFGYGPISDFRLGRNNQDIELTIVPSPDAIGPHNIADVQGNGHDIVFHRTEGPLDENTTRAIVVTGSNSTIVNETEYPVILEATASGNKIISFGPVTDNGSGNVVCTDLEECDNLDCGGDDPFSVIEAEDFCDQFGIQTEDTEDVGEGLNVGYIHDGDWLKFNAIDFGRGAIAFDARVASKSTGGDIEIRLGSETGELVGTLSAPSTGNWQTWETASVDLLEEIEGVHDLFLVFSGGININWFTFARSADNVNLALDGTATQSSTDWGGEAIRVNDGNNSGLWGDGSITHTVNELNPWLEIDLGSVQSIDEIEIYPRIDSCCLDRLALFTVSVLDADRNEVFARSYTKAKIAPFVLQARGAEGQVVRVQLDEENPLSLAEVEVYPYVDKDTDEDGMLDGVDPDDDNDGHADEDDLFPTNSTEWADFDEDGIGDNSDTDNDNDGVVNSEDQFPLDPLEWVDTDGDGIGDNIDADDDNDGYDDTVDLFPLDANDWADSDVDGIGDNSEIAPTPINLSTRGYVLDGDKVMIAGFVLDGTDPETVLVQGVGSELEGEPFLIEGNIVDTVITLYDLDGAVVATNDDWDSDSAEEGVNAAANATTGAFALLPDSKSSAFVVTLEPGIYTIHLEDKDTLGGVALIEVYSVK